MGRKVFISVLGAGMYESCKYTASSFCSTETRFVQQASLEYLNAQQWPEDSRAFFLITDKARTANWDVEGEQRFNNQRNTYVPYLGLQKILESSHLPFSFEGVSIPDGKDETEMWKIFETTYRLLNDGDELYFELTHSFRYLPMLMLVLGNYAKFVKKASVCSITYGNYEARNVSTNEAPIVNLLPLSSLQDWTFATADFLKNGYADRLVELANRGLNPLMRFDETRTDDTKRLKSFVNNLKSFSLDIQTCRGLNIIEASTIKMIKADINSLNKIVIPQLKPVLQQVSESVASFDDSGSVMNALKAAQWCFNNQLYQQATTFLEEGIIGYFCLRHDIDINDNNKRDLVTSAFSIKGQGIPEEKWRVKDDWKQLLCEIVNDELLSDSGIVNTFNSIAQLRNDYNHCGMRKSVLKPNTIKDNISSYLHSINLLLTPSNNIAGKDKESSLINFSNHPSQYWSREQIDAAVSYGRIIDLPFPVINPEADEADLKKLAEEYVKQILEFEEQNNITVHIMGEMTFTYMVVSQLKAMGIECIASTTIRDAEYSSDGKKISDFQFVRFRKY